jgi:alpha-beta hydrolase superfamily lysophospholipase
MSYNVFCNGCGKARNVLELVRTGNQVRCFCGHTASLGWWITYTRMAAKTPPNPLPGDVYVYWGARTHEGFGPGLLRGMMEKEGGLRPGASARRGAQPLSTYNSEDGVHKRGYSPDAHDYKELPAGDAEVRIFVSKDDVELKGQYYAARPNGGYAENLCMLLLNGSGGSIGHYMAPVIDGYLEMGAAVLAVDYRGIGLSTGRATSHGLYTDAEAMLGYLTDPPALNGLGWRHDRVVVHGFSFGSGPACELATHHAAPTDHPIAGLVLHCPFKSFGSAAAFVQGNEGAGKTQRKLVGKVASWGVGFNNIQKLLHMSNLPVHIVYAAADTNVNPQDARDMAAKQRTPRTTIQEFAGTHKETKEIFDGFVGGNTTQTLEGFVTTLRRV